MLTSTSLGFPVVVRKELAKKAGKIAPIKYRYNSTFLPTHNPKNHGEVTPALPLLENNYVTLILSEPVEWDRDLDMRLTH